MCQCECCKCIEEHEKEQRVAFEKCEILPDANINLALDLSKTTTIPREEVLLPLRIHADPMIAENESWTKDYSVCIYLNEHKDDELDLQIVVKNILTLPRQCLKCIKKLAGREEPNDKIKINLNLKFSTDGTKFSLPLVTDDDPGENETKYDLQKRSNNPIAWLVEDPAVQGLLLVCVCSIFRLGGFIHCID